MKMSVKERIGGLLVTRDGPGRMAWGRLTASRSLKEPEAATPCSPGLTP